ncbi:DUF3265 domain-containing protein [Vibrio cholerae]|nr:DUF3265 domain-containing protein [Vibrio cholerae]TYA62897.1 DUF3265 domain-containing protein [Vibrio cholerae]
MAFGIGQLTKRSRGTWHAWHLRFAVCLVVKVLCSNVVLRACAP